MFVQSVSRALVLTALGIFARSQARPQFEDVLTQIGLGYVFLFLLSWMRPRVQWTTAALILAGYCAAVALYPLPAPALATMIFGLLGPKGASHLRSQVIHPVGLNVALASITRKKGAWHFPVKVPATFQRGVSGGSRIPAAAGRSA